MKRSHLYRLLSLVAILALVLSIGVPFAAADGGPRKLSKPDLGERGGVGGEQGKGGPLVTVLVRLSDPPLAAYTGGIQGLAPTKPTNGAKLDANSPAAVSYLNYLAGKQADFKATLAKAIPNAKVIYQYRVVTNGLSLRLPVQEVATLSKLPGVTRVLPLGRHQLAMDVANNLINAPAIWATLGGQSNAGRGMKVAIIDTGIDPDAPFFNDAGYTAPPGYPRGDLSVTNNKIIVARGYSTEDPGSGRALDETGHGSMVAGVAAGNANTAAIIGTYAVSASGVAPGAYILSYNVAAGPGSRYLDDPSILMALDDAVMDGADVINMSFGYGANGVEEFDPMNEALWNVWNAGVVPVAAAGNSGPTGETADDTPGSLPAVIAAGAIDNARWVADTRVDVTAPTPVPSNLQNIGGVAMAFSAPYTTVGPAPYTFVGLACSPLTTDLTGKIALIQRGACTFVTKVQNAMNRGAIAAIVFNHIPGAPAFSGGGTLTPSIPALMVSNAAGIAMRDYAAANPDTAMVQFTMGTSVASPIPTPVIMSFSSRGPGQKFRIKPDVLAVGGDVLSTCQNNNPASGICYAANWWQFTQGTSFSSPHTAGAVALLRQLHPDWTLGQIRSALVTTGQPVVYTDYAQTVRARINDMGGGVVDLSKAQDPGLTYDLPAVSFGMINIADEPAGTVMRSVTITAKDTRSSGDTSERMYDLSVMESISAPGKITVTVTPTTLSFMGATSSPFTFAVDIAPDAPAGTYEGWIRVSHGPHQTAIPYWFRVINKTVTPGSILLVDDDRNGEEFGGSLDVSAYYAAALTDLGLPFTVWSTLTHGTPTLAAMKKAAAVVWFTGLDMLGGNNLPVLTGKEQEVIYEYLRQGGRLLLTGQRAGWDSVESFGTGMLFKYIPIQPSIYDPGGFFDNPPPRPSMWGVPNDPIAMGMGVDISWANKPDGTAPDGFGGNWSTEEIYPMLWEGATTIFSVQGTGPSPRPLVDGIVGVKASAEPSVYGPAWYPERTVFLPFGLEDVNDDTGFMTRAQLLGSILTWLTDEVNITATALTTATVHTPALFQANLTSSKGQPAYYRWNYGDGSPIRVTTIPTGTHVYQSSGTFTITVEGGDTLGHSAVTTLQVTVTEPKPDLSTSSKTANKTEASPEEKVTYTLTIANTGSVPATDPWIVDLIPAGTTYVTGSVTGGAWYNPGTNSILWGGAGPLWPGQSKTISYQVMVNAGTLPGTTIQNTATFRDYPSNIQVTRTTSFSVIPQPVVTFQNGVSPDATYVGTEDTAIAAWFPTTNYGSGALGVRAADYKASIIRFDLSSIPAGATIKSATLSLYTVARTNVGATTIGSFQLYRPWSEATATWRQAMTGVPWETAGANGPTDRASTPSSTATLNSVGTWVNLDITSIVQSWINGSTNAGVALKYTSGDVQVEYTLASSEWPFTNLRPKLTVQYVRP